MIDNVGGPITGELIRSMGFGGRVIINGGMSTSKFELHNFGILLSGIEIKSHVYRYFFNPPKEGHYYPQDDQQKSAIDTLKLIDDYLKKI